MMANIENNDIGNNDEEWQPRRPAARALRVSSAVARPGFRTVTPWIGVDDVDRQIRFLRQAFGAEGDAIAGRPAEMRIGDSVIMVTEATERDRFAAFLCIYVADADRCYEVALAAGGESMENPRNTPYGDRRAMVRDPFGNVFQIASLIE